MSILFVFLPILLFCFFIYIQVASKKKAGYLLLDLGPINVKVLVLVLGYAGILFNLYNLYHAFSPKLESWQYSNMFFDFIYGAFPSSYLLMAGYSRLQACENGILLYGNLLPWERIESFSWEPENEKSWILTLRYPGRLPAFWREKILFISVQKKDEFAFILENHASKMSLKGEK